MTAPVVAHYGPAYSCFNCDEFSPEAPTRRTAEQAAHDAGWRLGLAPPLVDAQIACPDCVVLLCRPGPCSPEVLR